MKRYLVLGLLFLVPPFLKPLLLRLLLGAVVEEGVEIGWFASVYARRITLRAASAIRPLTVIVLDGDLDVGAESEISSFCLVYGSANLRVGRQSYIGPQSLLNADEEIHIGDNSALGPRSMVFTHGSFLPYTEGYWVRLAGVTVGDRVWCAAGVFLHPGVEIGNDCFVNSRSVVTQSVPPDSIVEGNPGKVVQALSATRRQMTPRRVDAALAQVLHEFARICLRRELGVQDVAQGKYTLDFVHAGQRYHVFIVPSAGEATPTSVGVDVGAKVGAEVGAEVGADVAGSGPGQAMSAKEDVIRIGIVNRSGWHAPSNVFVLDAVTNSTTPSHEPMHQALVRFAKRYYGLRFARRE